MDAPTEHLPDGGPTDHDTNQIVLSIDDLYVGFPVPQGMVHAVNGVSYQVHRGEVLAVVGESGSGKTVTVLSAVGLLEPRAAHISGSVTLLGTDMLSASPRVLRSLLGSEVTMVFQDPTAALNPVMPIEKQINEVLHAHRPGLTKREAHSQAVDLLTMVGVPEPELRLKQYPHELSGGMCQRVVIAIAIANRPRLLIADEPTTAVDVTIQAQLLDLIRTVQTATGTAIILITHDLGVVAEIADRVCVMYAGRVVETGDVLELFEQPRHPYTAALLSCLPHLDTTERLTTIPGQPPNLIAERQGCAFEPRCPLSRNRPECRTKRPKLRGFDSATGGVHLSACHFADELMTDLGTR